MAAALRNTISYDAAVSRLYQCMQVLQRSGVCLRRVSSAAQLPPPPSTTPTIQVTPPVSVFDQKVDVKVQGLPGNVKVTLHNTMESKQGKVKVQFVANAHFVTSKDGEVDCAVHASHGGTYNGVDPMGLFWSMQPSPGSPQNIRARFPNGQYEFPHVLSVYPGHVTMHDIHTERAVRPIASLIFQRTMVSPGVRRIPVTSTSGANTCVRGTLFLPPGPGPHPGVLDIYGYVPGMKEFRSALLASRGFASLALAYFGVDDLPSEPNDIDFEYFEEAARWLLSQDGVKKDGVGVVGNCGGSTVGQLMAWKCPEVKALATASGLPFFPAKNLRRRGQLFQKGILYDPELYVWLEEGANLRDCYVYSEKKDFIPVWESSVPYLAIVGCDDQQIPPSLMERVRELYPEDRRHLMEVVMYPDTGHLIDPPYTPFCRHSYHAGLGVDALWGGQIRAHMFAQEDSWKRMLSFLRKHLGSAE